MRREKRTVCILLAILLASGFMYSPLKVKAGASEIVLDGSSLATSSWRNPEKDVVVEEEKLIFPESSTEYTRFISKTSAEIDENFSNLVNMSADVKFNQLPAGKSFILAFGLSSIEAVAGQAKNVEVAFTNASGIKCSIKAYNDNGEEVNIVSAKACGISLKKTAKVQVTITTDSIIKVSVNGNTLGTGKLPVTGEGRVGFLQTGECAAEIANLEVTRYSYERPENANVYEDFEKGTMDVSVLTAKVIDTLTAAPRGQSVEQYNGNWVLATRNTGVSYIGTVYQYSNFEMSFDVPYMDRTTEYSEEGELVKQGQTSFTVSMGGELSDWDVTGGWKKAAEAIVFAGSSIYSYNDSEGIKGEFTEKYFSTPDRGASVKIRVVDGDVTVGIKWMDESTYHTVLSYQLKRGVPNGYLHIWTTSIGQYAIDNLKIENLDENPNLIETEYQSGKIEVPQDVEYEQMERVYDAAKETEDKEGLSWYWLIVVSAVVVAEALVICAFLTRKKNKKRKEALVNEK